METQEKEINLKKLWWVFRRFILWIAIFTILGAVAMGVYTKATAKVTYTTHSGFYVARTTVGATIQGTVYENQTSVSDAEAMVDLLAYNDTLSAIFDAAKVGHVDDAGNYVPFSPGEIATIRGNLSIRLNNEDTSFITIQVKDYSAKNAYNIAWAFEQKLGEYAAGKLGKKSTDITVVQKAVEPKTPDGIPLMRNVVIGAAAGMLLSYLVFFIFDALDNSVRGKDELVTRFPNMPVVGAIPKWVDPSLTRRQKKLEAKGQLRDYENKLIGENTSFSIVESFRSLRTNVSYLITDHANVIGITSVKTGECKSVVSCNLAMSYSQLKKRVLLIEGDMRLPSIHEICHINVKNGLPEVLAGIESDYKKVLVPLNEYLDVMPVGQIPPNPAELLASDALRTLFEKLREEYDLIVLDLPPIGTVSDAGIVADVVDQFLISTRVNTSNLRALTASLRDMEHMEMKVGGFVISGLEDRSKYSKSPYYYDRYGVRQSRGNYRYGNPKVIRRDGAKNESEETKDGANN